VATKSQEINSSTIMRRQKGTPPEGVLQRLRQYGQDHVLRWWDDLTEPERAELLEQVEALDLEQLQQLYAQKDRAFELPSPERIQPVRVARASERDGEVTRHGDASLVRGEVAVLIVAGGQASRLGVDFPKGMFPIGPVTNKTLFQIHAEKTLAVSRRHETTVPFLVMTSPATHEETVSFFESNHYFGLPADQVHFFRQGTMPALDIATGKLLLEKRGRLFTSPNGHGGTLTALAESGLLKRLTEQGIRHVFYFQVDNPLVKVADPVFLGHHLEADAEVSSKVVPKESPTDKLGNMVVVDGRCKIIEYSDLPETLARKTDDQGRLYVWAGNPAIHIFRLDFLDRVTRHGGQMPFHVARKKVPFLNEDGETVQPDRENALKFERFIFDVLPLADRWTAVETSRREEFVPLKNASGPDSPDAVRQAMCDLAADWLARAGASVPMTADGHAAVPLEISPLYALDAEELAAKVKPGLRITGPTYLG
jgi:UDP-N-acetylglucosamine/UDP-N-acetylgalactosamine diphosphorylase